MDLDARDLARLRKEARALRLGLERTARGSGEVSYEREKKKLTMST
jgi:hypothetical protein